MSAEPPEGPHCVACWATPDVEPKLLATSDGDDYICPPWSGAKCAARAGQLLLDHPELHEDPHRSTNPERRRAAIDADYERR